MREDTSSKEPLNSSSDHERSFERSRGSYIASINRSLEHAFEFLSETGYASGGISDAERVESRCEDDQDHSKEQNCGELLHEINAGLKECGMPELKIPQRLQTVTEYKPGRLWGVSEKIVSRKQDTEFLNHKNQMHKTVSEEKLSAPQNGMKIILYQHVNNGNRRKNVSKSMENIGPKRGLNRADSAALVRLENRRNSSGKKLDTTRPGYVDKESWVPGKKLHEREDSGYESKAESRNGALQNGHVNESGKRNSINTVNTKQVFENDRRETTRYLTTEREILKQLLINAKETEQLQCKHRRKSKSLSNLDLRRAASKISLGPSQRQKTPVNAPDHEHKRFKKFRESFRKTTSYFMPQKFAVQEEKGKVSDFSNAIEFQYHCMHESRDGNKSVSSSKNLTGKKKGFFRQIFERKKQQPQRKQRLKSFRSSESINQFRWQSRENLSKKAERPKSISMLIDKVKEPVDYANSCTTESQSSFDEKKQIKRNSFSRGSRFRRSESLRSIPSTSVFTDVVLRPNETESVEVTSKNDELTSKSTRNRPVSLLLRASSFDQHESKTDLTEYGNLQRVLKNRLSCCSINEYSLRNGFDEDRDFDLYGGRGPGFISSSPRKNDDITDWIRGLQFSSETSNHRVQQQQQQLFERHDQILEEEEPDFENSVYNQVPFFHETRIVNGQIQTYL